MSRVDRSKHLQVKRARDRKRYAAAKVKGLCTGCKKRLPVEGKSRCQKCLDARKAFQKGYMARRRNAWATFKLCLRCGSNSAMPYKTICGRCSELDTENARLRRARKKLEAVA